MQETVYDLAYRGLLEPLRKKLNEVPASILEQDENCRLLIHWACLSGNSELVHYLLELGSPINVEDDRIGALIEMTDLQSGMSPLILASVANRTEIVKLLLERGADVNHRTKLGHSSLQYAASKGWREILLMLIEKGADVNVTDDRGATPLHRAASVGSFEIVTLLLSNRARPDIQDACGNSPLHLACEEERVEVAQALLNSGANPDLLNKEKKTARDTKVGRKLLQ